jgi:reactive intermediate/imine deaminase
MSTAASRLTSSRMLPPYPGGPASIQGAAVGKRADCTITAVTHHREEFRVEGMAEPLSHYTDAVKAGGLLFVSGIVPLDVEGKLVGDGDVAEQARQVFLNMQLCLQAAGCGFDDVVKVVHYLLDVDDRPKINPVRMEFFGEARPASTLVEVSALAVPGALLEIEAVAAIPS